MGWSFSFKQHGHISLGVWAMAAVRSITCTLSLISFTAVSPCSFVHVFAQPPVSLKHTYCKCIQSNTHMQVHAYTHIAQHIHTYTHTHTLTTAEHSTHDAQTHTHHTHTHTTHTHTHTHPSLSLNRSQMTSALQKQLFDWAGFLGFLRKWRDRNGPGATLPHPAGHQHQPPPSATT